MEIKNVTVSNEIEYPKKTEMHEYTFNTISNESIYEGAAADMPGAASSIHAVIGALLTLAQIELVVITSVTLVLSICLYIRANQIKKKKIRQKEYNENSDNSQIDDSKIGISECKWFERVKKLLIGLIVACCLFLSLMSNGSIEIIILFYPILLFVAIAVHFSYMKSDERLLKKGANRRMVASIILIMLIIGFEILKKLV